MESQVIGSYLEVHAAHSFTVKTNLKTVDMEKFLEFHLKRMDLLQNHEHSNQITTSFNLLLLKLSKK